MMKCRSATCHHTETVQCVNSVQNRERTFSLSLYKIQRVYMLDLTSIRWKITLCDVKSEHVKSLDSYSVRGAFRKKYGIIWEFSPNGGPPPLLGTPRPKKK